MALSKEQIEAFKEGIRLILNSWWQIQNLTDFHTGAESFRTTVDQMRDSICSWFVDSNEARDLKSAMDSLPQFMGPQHMGGFAGEIGFFDDSVNGVSEQIFLMYEECSRGDFRSIDLIIQANITLARREMQEAGHKGFEVSHGSNNLIEQIHSAVKVLWDRGVVIEHQCESNPQKFAEELSFWFTQTIKSIGEGHMEWIIRNKFHVLPIRLDFNDINDEDVEDIEDSYTSIVNEVVDTLMVIFRSSSTSR